MKRLAISLIVGAVAVAGLLFTANVPQPQITHQQTEKHNAAEELRALHQQIVRETILY
jgi:hypothetical protein